VRLVDDVVPAFHTEPLERESVARGDRDEGGDGVATLDVAREVGRREVFDGVCVGRGPDVNLLAVTLIFAVYPGGEDACVWQGC
jgi:hypothetical protein